MPDIEWTIRFTGYLPADDRVEDRLQRICDEIGSIPDSALQIDEANGVITVDCTLIDGWQEISRNRLKTIQAGRRVVIKPPWEDAEFDPDAVVVTIDPGSAFGSGLHESTRLCIRELEDYVRAGCTVMDIGTGTGVLAITAVKLGAGSVIAFDIDTKSIEAAKSNVRLNGVSDIIQVLHAGELPTYQSTVDLVAANITAETITSLLDRIGSLLESGGVFIASGMTHQNALDVKRLLPDAGFDILHENSDGHWVAVTSIKK